MRRLVRIRPLLIALKWATCYLPSEAAAVADGLELLYANAELSHEEGGKKL
jgi:hypothetical protein